MYLTKENIESALKLAYRKNIAHHLMILLAAQHGMRISEVANLTLEDIANGQIKVRRVKGSSTTLHPMIRNDNHLFNEPTVLARWLKDRPNDASNALFPSRNGGFLTPDWIGQVITSYLALAGVETSLQHAHSLKHFAGSYLCRKGMPIEFIRIYLGHKDIKNTAIYLNITDSEAAQKAQEIF